MQAWHFVGNVQPVLANGQPLDGVDGARIKEMHIVPGSLQDNAFDCGCHTIMALRSMAVVGVKGRSWFDLGLPEHQDVERDAAWRMQIAAECFAGAVALL